MQVGRWVFGVEGDVTYQGHSKIHFSQVAGTPIEDTLSVDWKGHLLARVGYDINGWLPYVTGGAVFANIEAAHTGFITPTETYTWSEKGVRTGYSYGVGVEKQLGNGWSVRGEYLYDYWRAKNYDWVPGQRYSDIALTIYTVRFAAVRRF